MQEKNRTEIATLGEFGLIKRLTENIQIQNPESKYGVGDDAAVLEFSTQQTLVTTDLLMEGVHVAHDAIVGNGCILGNSTKLAGEIIIDDNAILSAGVLMHQFCRVGSYTMIGGGTRFSQNVLPFSLVAREPAAFCGLNTVGLRRRGFDRDLINNIHMAYQIILQGTGKLNDLLARVEQEIPMSPEIQYILDFIRSSDRGFIR